MIEISDDMKNYDFSALTKERIIEKLNAANVGLTDEELKAVDSEHYKHIVYGHRRLGGF